MKNISFLALSILIFSIGLNGQNTSSQTKYDAILESTFSKDGSGITALVAKDGKIIYTKAMGNANIELDIPTKIDHVFRIGSITKQFTAVAILMLEEQGKLGLQDEITKFIPDYPTQGKTISVEHLLTHTSGIQSYTNLPNFGEFMSKALSLEEMIDVFKNEPMEFEPGTTFKYNNSGYFLLGAIIEKVSGQSYADFIQTNIFDKAGMSNSYYGAHQPIIKNRASGYTKNNGEYGNAQYISMDWPYAAGSLLSTVEDLLKWNTALHDGKFISEESLEKAMTSYQLKDESETLYGYGWRLSQLYGSPTYEHGGGIPGFLTYGLYLPKEKIYVAVFSNCGCQEPEFSAVELAVEALGKSIQKDATIELNEATKKGYTGIYQISGEDKRTISLGDDGALYSQRGGRKYKIEPVSKDKFAVENSLTVFEFVRNDQSAITEMIAHTRDGDQETAKLTDEKPVERKVIEVDSKILDLYVGDFELVPGFSLNITNENGQLHAQATGQPKFPLFAENQTKFFLKVVDAQVEFFKDDKGMFSKLTLYQGGREMPGVRK